MTNLSRIGGVSEGGSVAIRPDAHGRAALLLAESIVHILIETGAITTVQALSIVGSAQDIQGEIAATVPGAPGRIDDPLVLLDRIAASLQADLA